MKTLSGVGIGHSQNIQTQTIVVFIGPNLKPHPKREIGSVWRPNGFQQTSVLLFPRCLDMIKIHSAPRVPQFLQFIADVLVPQLPCNSTRFSRRFTQL